MRIVTLNTWGGRVTQPLFDFLERHQDVEVLCLQEIFSAAVAEKIPYELTLSSLEGKVLDLYQRIAELLPNHRGIFQPVFDDYYGLATFVRRDVPISGSGSLAIYDNPHFPARGDEFPDHPRSMLWVEVSRGGQPLFVGNVHGHWTGAGKGDTPARIEQSRRIVDFLVQRRASGVICGDFNLLPDTQSLRMIEDAGLRNLVTDYGVTSTRTSLYGKPEKFADYVFVSPGLPINDFKVLSDEVSDHAALLVEIGAA